MTKDQEIAGDKRLDKRRSTRLRWLRRLYDELNVKHWDGLLPKVLIFSEFAIVRSAGTYISGDISFSNGPLAVATANELRQTLLHEMCHVAVREDVPSGHGPRWRTEMERVCPKELEWHDRQIELTRALARRVAALGGKALVKYIASRNQS